jgi:hypothetical protein
VCNGFHNIGRYQNLKAK